jgi:hypothetical protein
LAVSDQHWRAAANMGNGNNSQTYLGQQPLFLCKTITFAILAIMKKKYCIITILLALFMNTKAQQPFTGIIEYELTGMAKNKSDQPEKLTMLYGMGKLMMKAFFKEDQKEEWILLNTETDTMYSTQFSTKTYEKEALISKRSLMDIFDVTPLDSFKTYFGYRCRGHRLSMDRKTLFAYVWVAEDLLGLPVKPGYQHPVFQITGAPHVMLCMEIYKDDQREGSFIPVSLTKMDQVPDSLFALTGYKESTEPGIDEMIKEMNEEVAPAVPDTSIQYRPKAKAPAKKKTPVKKSASKIKKFAFIRKESGFQAIPA